MDHIEFLLQSLSEDVIENKSDDLEKQMQIKADSPSKLGTTQQQLQENNVVESVLNNDYDFEITKKQLSSKYSGSAYEINKMLKENDKSRPDFNGRKQNTWSTKKPLEEKNHELVVPNNSIKQDVYAEPIFGLRLVNPIVSSSHIQMKMTGKHAVPVSNISNYLTCGDKNKDWVFAGAVVFKSGLKTSQKGNQYCLWKISDLKRDLKQVTLYLFGKACSDLWKVSLGTVTAVLNATPFYKDEKINHNEITLTIKSADQIMIWGSSRDYGICQALKKNGEKCTSFVNKSECEFCVFHVKKEYNKYAGNRSNLQAPSIGLANLRNKVLGKSEVFYAGKSYTAVNVPKRDNNQKKTTFIPKTVVPSGVSKKLRESDQCKLEKLISSKNQLNKDATKEFVSENISTKIPKVPAASKVIESNSSAFSADDSPSPKTNNSLKVAQSISPSKKPVTSRLHLLKKAGAKMLDSGQTTRITFVNKKSSCLSFSDVLMGCHSPLTLSKFKDVAEIEKKSEKITLNQDESIIDFSADIKSSRNLYAPPTSNERNRLFVDKKASITTNSKKVSTVMLKNTDSSRILQDFENLTKNATAHKGESEPEKTDSHINTSEVTFNVDQRHSVLENRIDGDRSVLRAVMQLHSSPSSAIHERRRAQAKMNAICLIKRQGGLTKSNPNQVRPDPNRRKAVKRPADSDDTDAEECLEKSVLSQRFIELMNTASKHENLIQIAEDVDRLEYFNKMEKKEQLEEKMLTTYKVPCKAVICLKCKYKWFSASDLCRAEGHPIKVIDTVKRYFKCDNCNNRTVSLELVPLMSCKLCGVSKWSRAGMIREKLAKNENLLSIRGEESKFLDSLSHSMNLNLLVPEDK